MPENADKATRTVSVPGTLRVLERVNPYEFNVRIDIMRDGLNNNRWIYRNLEKHYKTFLGQPILIAYVGNKIGDGHNMREEIAPDGGRVYTFIDGTAERIIGVLSEKEEDFTLYERDGNLWVSAKGKIFTFYAHEAVEKIIATGAMDVSAETDVYKAEIGPEDTEIFEDWAGIGVTILGDDVPPAIPGARIKQLAQIREDVDGMKIRAAALLAKSKDKHDAPETKPEKGVKTIMNSRERMLLQQKFEGYTVLNASDDGMRVCLMKDGGFFGYVFNAEDGDHVVVPERIRAMRAITTFAFGDDEDSHVAMDACVPTDMLTAKVAKLNAEAADKDKRITELEAQVDTMRRNERERRIEAAKNAVNQKFRDMNAVRECMFDNDLAERVCQMCNEGKFCEDEDENGRWCGDKNAVNALMAACMEAQADMDKKAADKRKEAFNAWNFAKGDGKDQPASNIEQMLAFVGK
jgi:hypothetical protein